MNNAEFKYWYALYTKSRHELKASEQLSEAGIQNYLPTITKIKQWSDRKKKIIEPVLRGYIFVLCDEHERQKALELSSIVRCVSDLGRPAIIPNWQIENLKKVLAQETEILVKEGLVTGTKVEIKEGPFAGVIGVIYCSEDRNTIAVSIDLLNRTIIAHFPKNIVEKFDH